MGHLHPLPRPKAVPGEWRLVLPHALPSTGGATFGGGLSELGREDASRCRGTQGKPAFLYVFCLHELGKAPELAESGCCLVILVLFMCIFWQPLSPWIFDVSYMCLCRVQRAGT